MSLIGDLRISDEAEAERIEIQLDRQLEQYKNGRRRDPPNQALKNRYDYLNNDWGSTGHRVVGEIAEKNISSETRKKIFDLLNE